VPESVRDLTHTFPYNDAAALQARLDEFHGRVAAVILEPMNVVAPDPGYLQQVRDLTRAAGAVLIFDETITGFRYANGGAQEKFGVTPDLATLGKGIANGFPLSAVCGRRDIMMEMEEVFFSFTMGGETMSLAAAKAAIHKLLREPVVATMRERGTEIVTGLHALIESSGAGDFLSVAGDPTWSFLLMKDMPDVSSFEIKTLFLQEILARGVMSLGTHNMSYAHSREDVRKLLDVYGEVVPVLVSAVKDKAVRQYLKCDPLQPLFKVR
jgi:glutamate-1-semialdehyde 2,1-aminomutase